MLACALESALAELADLPDGLVELLVSDNASGDETPAVVAGFQARLPALRSFRQTANLDFDQNYIACVREARGQYVWLMGDDDAWRPGSVARILLELEQDPDAVLCAALECDLEMRPREPRGWFDRPGEAPAVWDLRTPADLIAYFDALRFQAGAFAFISVAIIRRDRLMAILREVGAYAVGTGYIHVAAMVGFLQSPCRLHWVDQPLVLNRLGNDKLEAAGPWERGMPDLRAWRFIGDRLLGGDPALRAAFMGVLRRNHQDIMVRRVRMGAADDEGRWAEARENLLAVGFDPLWVEVADFLYRLYILEVPLAPSLRPEGICLADLPLVTLGARRAAVFVPGGLPALMEAAVLLEALRDSGRMERILVVCDPGGACLLEGFEVLELDPVAFALDRARQDEAVARLREFRPGLVVNADRTRGLAGDLLAARAQAPATLGFQGRAPGLSDELFKGLDKTYTLRLPVGSPAGALAEALGLAPGAGRLWPDPACREEAGQILAGTGWDPARIFAVSGDEPLGDPDGLAALVQGGGALVGLGGRGSFRRLDPLLEPLGDRAMNLGEALDPGTLAALLACCGGFVGAGATGELARLVRTPAAGRSSR